MGLFFRNFDKPGPGVDPDAPQKRSFFRFFDIFFRKLGHFSRANLLYCLALIPTYIIVFIIANIVVLNVVDLTIGIQEDAGLAAIILSFILANFYVAVMGAGPATAGITYIMRNFAREEHAWIGSDFVDNLKSNFKQAVIVFVIDIAVSILVFFSATIYSQMTGMISVLKYFLYVFVFIYMMMHMYIYPIMVTFKMPLKDIYRNSLIFSLGKLPSNLIIMIAVFFVHIVIPIFILFAGGKYFFIMLLAYGVLEIIILQIFTLFMINFNVYPKMKKYMLDVAEANNAEQRIKSLAEEIAEENADQNPDGDIE